MRLVQRSVRIYGTLFLYARHYAQSGVLQVVYQLASPWEPVGARKGEALGPLRGQQEAGGDASNGIKEGGTG